MKLDCGDQCPNGVPYCWCFLADVKSEGLTLDFDSAKGLGEMQLIRSHNSLSQSHSDGDIVNQYDEQSFDSDSSTYDEEEEVSSEKPVYESSVSNRLESKCDVLLPPEEIIPAIVDEVVVVGVPEIPCPLCSGDNKPKGVSNLKIQCHGGCQFLCHFECYLAAMKKQGLTKKKDYKDSVCPTDGCGYFIHLVHKIRSDEEDELYVMGTSEVKHSEPVVRKEKKKDHFAHQKKGQWTSCKLGKKDTSHEINDLDEPLPEGVSQSAEVPCSSKNRAAPLSISEPVIPLEKKANKIEEKYAVSSSAATSRKNAKKPKKNDTFDLTDVLMKSKRDDPQNTKSTSDSRKVKSHAPPVEVTRSVENILWEEQELGAITSPLLAQPIDSSPTTLLDQIADKLERYLPELVLNTPKWSPHALFPSVSLCNAILAVGIDIFSDEETTEITNLFLGGFLQIKEFVEKLKYFTCVKNGFHTKIIKNDFGRLLEEEREDEIARSMAATIPTAPSGHECLICLESDQLDHAVGVMHCPDCKEPYHTKTTIETMESSCIHGFALCLCSSDVHDSINENMLFDASTNREDSQNGEDRHCETEFPSSDSEGAPVSPDSATDYIIGCSLCFDNIQLMVVSYMQIVCYGCCSFSCHRNCYFDAMQKQGFNRKKDFKDASCPTDGCGNKVLSVHEIDLQLIEKLYYKDSKAKSTKSELAVTHKDKRRDSCLSGKKSHNLKRRVRLNDTNKTVSPSFAESLNISSEAQCGGSAVPSILRTAPLPLIAFGNVVPLEKKLNEVEEKYSVSTGDPFKKVIRKTKKMTSVNITDVLVYRKKDQKFHSHQVSHNEGLTTGSRTIFTEPAATGCFREVPSNWEDLDDDFEQESEFYSSNSVDCIILKLESFLSDLVFNTVSFMRSEYLTSDDLKDAILCVGCDVLSNDEKSDVRTIFRGDFLSLQEFVTKLKYFECVQINFQTKIRKNNLGRALESEGIPSFPSSLAQMYVDPPGLIHPNVKSRDRFSHSPVETHFFNYTTDEPGKREQFEERCKLQASIAEDQHVSKMIQLKLQKLNLLVDVRRNEKALSSEQPNSGSNSMCGSNSKATSSQSLDFCTSSDNIGFGGDISIRSNSYGCNGVRDSSSHMSWNSSFNECSSTSNMVAVDVHQNALNNISKLEFELRKADMDRKKIERENQKLRQEVETMKNNLQNSKNFCMERHTDLSILTAEAGKIGKIVETVNSSDKVRICTMLLECEKRLTYIASALAHSDSMLQCVTDLKLAPDGMISELSDNVEKWREFETQHLRSLLLLKEGHIVMLPEDDDVPMIPNSIYEFFIESFKNSVYPYIRLASDLETPFKTLLASRACLTKDEFPTEDVIQSFIIESLRMKRNGGVDVRTIVDEYISQNGCVLQSTSHDISSSKNDQCGIWKNVRGCDIKREVDLSENECMICYDSLLDETMDILNCPSCKEPFHFKCVTTWLSQSPACPKCRFHWPDPEDFPSLK